MLLILITKGIINSMNNIFENIKTIGVNKQHIEDIQTKILEKEKIIDKCKEKIINYKKILTKVKTQLSEMETSLNDLEIKRKQNITCETLIHQILNLISKIEYCKEYTIENILIDIRYEERVIDDLEELIYYMDYRFEYIQNIERLKIKQIGYIYNKVLLCIKNIMLLDHNIHFTLTFILCNISF